MRGIKEKEENNQNNENVIRSKKSQRVIEIKQKTN